MVRLNQLLYFVLLSFFFSSNNGYCQITHAEIIYKIEINSISRENSNKKIRDRVEGIRKEIKKLSVSLLYKDGVSSFGLTESISIEDPQIRIARLSAQSMSGIYKKTFYALINEKKIIKAAEFDGKDYLIHSSFNDYNWTKHNETKMIDNQLCYKASRLQRLYNSKGEEFSFEIVAWYNPKIPIPLGPKENAGLPGLILELEEVGRMTYYISKLSINPDKEIKIKLPEKGKKLSVDEFSKITNKHLKRLLNNG